MDARDLKSHAARQRKAQKELTTEPGRISRTTRVAGARVNLFRATPDLDTDGNPWVTDCETHGVFMVHATRKLALAALSYPEDWCQDCRDKVAAMQIDRKVAAAAAELAAGLPFSTVTEGMTRAELKALHEHLDGTHA